MKIGIDFDNTIANYEQCFNFLTRKYFYSKKKEIIETKNSIKKKILNLKDGKYLWMKMQGQAYGKYIDKALVMNDFLKFLLITKNRKHTIVIVSHKTKFGHYDKKKILLRKSATRWMIKNKIINSNYSNINKGSIFYADTRENKINIINKLQCDYFIDDLFSVLNDKKFSQKTNKILFGKQKKNKFLTFENWNEIINFFYPKLLNSDIIQITNFFHKNKLKKITSINKSGNSQSYKLELKNAKKYFIKIYPSNNVDRRDRLLNEFKAINFLNKFQKFNIPKTIKFDHKLNVGVYEFIKGRKVLYPNDEDLNSYISFIHNLKKISNKNNIKNFNLASETSINYKNLLDEISLRKDLLTTGIDKKKYKSLLNNLNLIWKKLNKKNLNSNLKSFKKYFILSPSDNGFHNVLKVQSKLFYFDFEYFGLDDPIKITSDFIIHPANNLKETQLKNWYNSMKTIFSNINNFDQRFEILFPYFLFRWILIILKIINKNYQNKYMQITNISIKKLNENITDRISLAKYYIVLLNKIQKNKNLDFKDFSYEQRIKR